MTNDELDDLVERIAQRLPRVLAPFTEKTVTCLQVQANSSPMLLDDSNTSRP